MPKYFRWPDFQVDESYQKHCDNCDQLIQNQLFFHWSHKDFNLCSDCLQDLYETTFNIRPLEVGNSALYQKKTIPDSIRWHIWNRDDFTCQYCGIKENLSIDHIVPESKGGDLLEQNLVTACRPCNSKKNNRTPEEAGMKIMNDPRH
ncbi:HNH endonuclease [Domibacillus aminovorans]|uniref:HNH nuclease domain-containing protein n=1 Tax=Domibacillus aminovorans TaxID=29332 RepID=A0A177L335_9BACI|nr:HNH endonuclease [Domibacillus aminovorans]OAH60100.1 hypothetical protein AWH49_18010 [Domibacillus aminovorans]